MPIAAIPIAAIAMVVAIEVAKAGSSKAAADERQKAYRASRRSAA